MIQIVAAVQRNILAPPITETPQAAEYRDSGREVTPLSKASRGSRDRNDPSYAVLLGGS